ncbi:uncharacterized protein LOC131658719 [Vicia villosa]|uniref:uncharacterized protein LOC131658719 n=1 Tax=Vicia villosa TaxID=3911 RepID=UPI00273B5C43|nr:uncharacterized protein LOC131658719 [Vicia villosa]
MIIATFNIRGSGNTMKQKRISQIVRKINPQVMFIQETKIGKMTEQVIWRLWGSKDCEWSAKEAIGRSGGIVTIWRKGVFCPEFTFGGKGFLGLKIIVNDKVIYFINVYSPCSLSEKREMWLEIIRWRNKLDRGEWVVGGDFNSVKNREERRGKENHSRGVEMEEFKCFIETMELVDLQVMGSLFTWIKPNGKAGSRLDRILLTGSLISNWEIVAQEVGMRDVSDHKPVWTKSSKVDWGPKSFRVLKCWYEHKDFQSFIQNEWNAIVLKGSPGFILKEKLIFLRGRLRWWNREVFGMVELKIQDIVNDLNRLEDKMLIPNINL